MCVKPPYLNAEVGQGQVQFSPICAPSSSYAHTDTHTDTPTHKPIHKLSVHLRSVSGCRWASVGSFSNKSVCWLFRWAKPLWLVIHLSKFVQQPKDIVNSWQCWRHWELLIRHILDQKQIKTISDWELCENSKQTLLYSVGFPFWNEERVISSHASDVAVFCVFGCHFLAQVKAT